MSEDGEGQELKSTPSMILEEADFSKSHEGKRAAWGLEVEIDISDSLVRSRFQENVFKIPAHITKLKFLDLAPQESWPPNERNIRSKMKQRSIRGGSGILKVATPAVPGNERLNKIRYAFNFLKPEDERRFKALRGMVTWAVDLNSRERFNEVLARSAGDTLVVVHGHSSDLSKIGEQYPDELKDEEGNVVQRKGNDVPIEDILDRYNDPTRFAAVLLHACNIKKGSVEAKNVPVFYPTTGVKNVDNPGFFWHTPTGFSPAK